MPGLPDLRCYELDELAAFVRDELGESGYRVDQLYRWIHGRGARSFDEMSNLSKGLRAQLGERATLGTLEVERVQESADGTRKLRLITRDGNAIESVLIPDGDKLTQCISSQVGCALDCKFCATATMGLVRNLDAGEIADQVYRARAIVDRRYARKYRRNRQRRQVEARDPPGLDVERELHEEGAGTEGMEKLTIWGTRRIFL